VNELLLSLLSDSELLSSLLRLLSSLPLPLLLLLLVATSGSKPPHPS
jgi:hypothetical protein